MPTGTRLLINKNHYSIALGVIAVAFVLKIFYIFNFTSYHISLHNDMGSYWYDSFQRAWGDQTSINQWGNFAPFFKYYYYPFLFKFLNSIGWISYALPLAILINIFLYSISAGVFYLIVDRLIVDKSIALVGLVFYAFSYVSTYLNALVLPESFAVSLVVISTGMIILFDIKTSVFIAGLILGIAVAAKPLLIVFSPVFIWYIWPKDSGKDKLLKLMVFLIAFLIIPLLTISENNRVSHGKLKSIAAIGGVNFFQGWGKVGVVKTTSPEGPGGFYSPGAIDEKTWGPVTVTEPWYHQGYFYQLGIRSILHHPGVLVEKLSWFKKLFWGILGPSLKVPPAWYHLIMPAASNISYCMFLSLGLLFLFFKRHTYSRTIVFLFLLLAFFLMGIYLMGLPERRYFLNIEFLIITLFCITVNQILALYEVYKREIWVYVFFVTSLSMCLPMVWGNLNKILH